MRITANNPPERGFKRRPYPCRVLMDGKPLERVVRVDTGAGVAWITEVDKDGRIVFDRKAETICLRRIFGPMRVVPIEGEGEGQSLPPSGL